MQEPIICGQGILTYNTMELMEDSQLRYVVPLISYEWVCAIWKELCLFPR